MYFSGVSEILYIDINGSGNMFSTSCWLRNIKEHRMYWQDRDRERAKASLSFIYMCLYTFLY